MANNVVEFTLRAKDQVSRVLSSIGKGIAGFAKGLLNQGANLKAWGEMIAGAMQNTFGRVWGAVQEAFKFESLETQFKTLLGSMDAAKERMQMLAKVAEETPFDMEGVVKANRILTVMSKNALGTEWALKLVGDTAAAVGGNVDEMAMWIGRAYAMIQAGKPFGEAAMRLTELGALTPEVRQKMEDLQAAGASNSEVWDALVAHLETFGGAMKDLSKTGEGMMSTLEDNWTAAVREFGQAFMDSAKDSIGFLINKLAELQASGAITEWAEKAKAALEPVRNLVVGILGNSDSRAQAFGAAWDYLKEVFKYGGTILNAAGDYIAAKIADVGAMIRDSMAASAAIAIENIRFKLKELWEDISLGNMGAGAHDRIQARKQEHENIIAGIEEAAAEAHQKRLGKARERFAKALEAAGDELGEASEAMKEAFEDAAEAGRQAVEDSVAKAAGAKEDPEAKKARLAAEKAAASKAVNNVRDAATIRREQEQAMEMKRLEAEQEFNRKMEELAKRKKERLEAERKDALADLKPQLDARLDAAKDAKAEAYKRATDADYAREQEAKEKEEAKARERYNKRARALLERAGRGILSENFDLSKLNKRDRRLAEAMRAEREVKRLEKLREQAYEADKETAKNTKDLVTKINSLLALK